MSISKSLAIAALAALAGCVHNGTQATPSGNTLIMSRLGIPEFVGEPNRCPSANGEGTIQRSWESGETLHKGQCQGGLMAGEWTAYYENGAKEWTATFQGGVIVGTFKSWFANDEKRATVGFSDGVPNGAFKAWHINGELAAKGGYIGGKKNGCWETFHDNGQVASKGTYADDKQVLTWLYWTADGSKRKDKLGGEALHGQCLVTL